MAVRNNNLPAERSKFAMPGVTKPKRIRGTQNFRKSPNKLLKVASTLMVVASASFPKTMPKAMASNNRVNKLNFLIFLYFF